MNAVNDRLLKFFAYAHLRDSNLRDTSKMFHDLAHRVASEIPVGPERTVALRKLLEAKDCAIRATLSPGE